jgi:hypothetical protein
MTRHRTGPPVAATGTGPRARPDPARLQPPARRAGPIFAAMPATESVKMLDMSSGDLQYS